MTHTSKEIVNRELWANQTGLWNDQIEYNETNDKIISQIVDSLERLAGRIKALNSALEDASDEIDVLKRQVAALESAAQT